MKKYFEYKFNEEVRKRLIDYYNSQGMEDFDNGDKKTALKLDRIEKYIPYDKNDIICDVGCADAVLLKHIAGKYRKGIGPDISKEVIRKDQRLGLKNTEFRTYDGANIVSEEQFDKVFLMDVLEHAFDPDALIRSIYENLRAGGVLVIQVPSTGWLSELIFGKYHYGHLRYYDEKYLHKYLSDAGFKVRMVKTFNSVPWSQKIIKYPGLFKTLNAMCSIIPHVLYPYYGSVAAVAEK